jgi:polysaccharide export outer membrane protein
MKASVLALAVFSCLGQEGEMRPTYVLGPGDRIVVRVLDLDEMGRDPYQIDVRGNVNLPLAGRVRAAGLTPEALETLIAERLKRYLKAPEVTVSIHEMRSQPVSVLGSVKNPGVHQLYGAKTLLEVVSLAGGLSVDAGYSIRITRRKEWGRIPLRGMKEDDSGQYYTAEVGVKELMEGRAPEKNIPIKPEDVISVPKGELVYVMGAVKKSGGFVLGERETVTVLQALSMAEGMDNFAKASGAKILRKTENPERRLEIAVDINRILKHSSPDIPMQQDDILFVPLSGARKAIMRTLEAGITTATGVLIYRR